MKVLGLKGALPSQLRRGALLRECYPTEGPGPLPLALVVLYAAACGMALDGVVPGLPSFARCKADVYEYGELAHEALVAAGHLPLDIVQSGAAVVAAIVAALPAVVTDEALEEALTPTDAAPAAPIISSDDASGPCTSGT